MARRPRDGRGGGTARLEETLMSPLTNSPHFHCVRRSDRAEMTSVAYVRGATISGVGRCDERQIIWARGTK